MLDSWKLARVSDQFRVIALGLPVPPYHGNPLDPPLRSRFQARNIAHLPFHVSWWRYSVYCYNMVCVYRSSWSLWRVMHQMYQINCMLYIRIICDYFIVIRMCPMYIVLIMMPASSIFHHAMPAWTNIRKPCMYPKHFLDFLKLFNVSLQDSKGMD